MLRARFFGLTYHGSRILELFSLRQVSQVSWCRDAYRRTLSCTDLHHFLLVHKRNQYSYSPGLSIIYWLVELLCYHRALRRFLYMYHFQGCREIVNLMVVDIQPLIVRSFQTRLMCYGISQHCCHFDQSLES